MLKFLCCFICTLTCRVVTSHLQFQDILSKPCLMQATSLSIFAIPSIMCFCGLYFFGGCKILNLNIMPYLSQILDNPVETKFVVFGRVCENEHDFGAF